MNNIIIAIWILPILMYVISLVFSNKQEKEITTIALIGGLIHFLLICVLASNTLLNHPLTIEHKFFTLYTSSTFDFSIRFYWDLTSLIFSVLGVTIFLMVARFSKFYMHRDEGFRRFFNNLLLFYTGYTIIVLAGNFETFFIGWEYIGICSFLLIGFYRDRYLPVKNALKVISLFRLSDICLLVALWAAHHIFHTNIYFSQLEDASFLADSFQHNPGLYVLMISMILVAVCIKSGLVPFSSWVPRAMEGPTSSSAVFYGSLSIHIGLFLLIRTMPLWESHRVANITLTIIGLVTAFIASNIASVQPTIKTKIAYASIAQIGLIVIEIAWGLLPLAYLHILANAFLRTYQLLVSPSVLNYFIHDMFFKKVETQPHTAFALSKALYVLNIKEWNMDTFQFEYLWRPFKWLGNKFSASVVFIMSVFFILVAFINHYSFNNSFIESHIPEVLMIVSFINVLWTFASRNKVELTFLKIGFAQFCFATSISFNDPVPLYRILLFGISISIALIIGFVILSSLKIETPRMLNRYYGLAQENKGKALLFLVCCVAISGLPITPTFLGIDLLFTHILQHQFVLLIFAGITFLLIEISLLRIYLRIFTGPYYINDRPSAFRSS